MQKIWLRPRTNNELLPNIEDESIFFCVIFFAVNHTWPGVKHLCFI